MTGVFHYAKHDEIFRKHKDVLWGCLSRQNNVFIVANISLFFISGLVSKGYYYTFFSLGLLGLTGLIMVLPVPSYSRLWYYLIGLGCHLLGLYFLLSSVVYWLHTVRS
jgi:hypothetical protein